MGPAVKDARMSDERSAVIVGAGIGGLAAALSLQRQGWKVEVHERAAQARELGFALLLAPNAMRVLRELGVDQAVREAAFQPRYGDLRRPNGTVLRRIDSAPVQAALGDPAIVALRPVLHGALLNAVGSDTVKLSSRGVSIERHASGATLHLEGGGVARARVLIGADGVDSMVRKTLHPNEPKPNASGLFALRGISEGDVSVLGETSGAQYYGRGVEAGLARANATVTYWYISMLASQVPPGATPRAVLEHISHDFHEPFKKLVLATKPSDLRLDELLERAPLDSWGDGAVTLLGDAAHPMLPHAGQGAAQALEDALALGRALSRGDTPEDALRRYERVRSARTRRVVGIARRNAMMGSIKNPLACWARDAAFKLIPTRNILQQMIALGHPSQDEL
jgi:2-polyprenyl-6-methoxyphenol hydroxylase-like FAD-dependent oxidoreductase